MATPNQSDEHGKSLSNESKRQSEGEGIVQLSKHQEEKQSAESSAFEQVMTQMNIADRKTFDKKYSELWNEASENNELLTLMICEIDFFKAYHDNYGHQGASFMLLVIALALKSTCEELGCYLGRYRGDEFGVLVKGGTPEDAHEVAEKLRLAVEKSRTEHKHSSVSNIVTLSIGLSTFYPTSMKTVIEQAGSALVGAKTGGRNKVLTHLEQPSEYSVVEESDLVSKSSNELSSDTVVDKARQQHNTAEQQSDFVADVLKKEEMLRKEEIKKEEALRKEELEKEALKKAEELKQEELRKEEERKREEEIIREEKARKDALGMYDYDQYF